MPTVACTDCGQRFDQKHRRTTRCSVCAYRRRLAQNVAWMKRTGYVAPSTRPSPNLTLNCRRCGALLKTRAGQRSGTCRTCALDLARQRRYLKGEFPGAISRLALIRRVHDARRGRLMNGRLLRLDQWCSLVELPAEVNDFDDWRQSEFSRGASSRFWPSLSTETP